MDEKAIFKLCKDKGCCDACCLRYLGLKHQRVYENVKEWVAKYSEEPAQDDKSKPENGLADTEPTNGSDEVETNEPAAKRLRGAPCASCLGLLEPETWPDSCRMAKETLDKKGYDCTSFACALSAPLASLLRDKLTTLTIKESFPLFDTGAIPSLKEVWKWSLGAQLAASLQLELGSGAVAPLLLSLHYDYPDDEQELEILKAVSASCASRRRHADLTRRGAEQALEKATLEDLRALAPPAARARCVAAQAQRAPLYLGGRYIKLSRELPQTPWVVRGRRMAASSVQEIIFEPIADLYGWTGEERERRLKFVSAGREDVDARCRGAGRPFALEIADPRRELTPEELERACRRISDSGTVIVERLVPVTREDLNELKKGEETKCKEYEVLCIKLEHTQFDDPSAPVAVTAADVARINAYRNTRAGDAVRVRLAQRTPVRVLHRRPLLARERAILALSAEPVPGQLLLMFELKSVTVATHPPPTSCDVDEYIKHYGYPALFVARVATTAGTYVKEWAHGELGRTRPALAAALGARADVLALDVTAVALAWPPPPPPSR